MSQQESVNDVPPQTGQSSQAPTEGAEDQAEQSDNSQGHSSEAPATG